MALILCIETGTDICSVALARDGEMIALRESDLGKDHARKVGVFTQELLREHDIAPDELDAVAVGKGPGSYTGLRIGVSFAKGLCYALGIPLLAIDSLRSLAACLVEEVEAGIVDIEDWERVALCPMIDARRMEVYAELFDNQLNPLSEVVAEVVHDRSFSEVLLEGRKLVIFGNGAESLMMMLSDRMRVALVCNHTPIAQVSEKVTVENIMAKLQVLNQTLQTDFSCRKPRIAVLALNPHAGDNGLIGKEEQEVIRPAIAQAQEAGIWAFGPYSADGFFGAGEYNHFDAVLAMYHDQGLAPFKALDMSGVNFTAGLRVVRTSPDHGTAYGIAGKNEASETSMLHAIYTAIDVLKTRKENAELLSNQLVVEIKEVKREYHVEKFIPID